LWMDFPMEEYVGQAARHVETSLATQENCWLSLKGIT
jgi:hypothetical protein